MEGKKGLVEYVKYLRRTYDSFKHAKGGKSIDIVIGNSSGDMDSVVSSIGYSYFNYLRDGTPKSTIFPIISFVGEDLKLRKDIEYSLNKVGILEEDLIYVDEMEGVIGENFDRIRLVDHNDVDNAYIKDLLNKGRVEIVGIIDHHVDAGKYLGSNPRIIEVCGSCSSLVAKYFHNEVKRRYGEKGEEGITEEKRKEMEFLITALAIDTSAMTNKVENADREAFGGLYSHLIDEEALKSISKTAKEEKLNISGLSMYDLLRKDYKEYEVGDFRIGISSVGFSHLHLRGLYGEAAVEESILRWRERRGVGVAVVMTSFVEARGASGAGGAGGGVFRRELALRHGGDADADGRRVVPCVLSLLGPELALRGAAGGDAPLWLEQGAVQLSRKAVAPLLVRAVAQCL